MPHFLMACFPVDFQVVKPEKSTLCTDAGVARTFREIWEPLVGPKDFQGKFV